MACTSHLPCPNPTYRYEPPPFLPMYRPLPVRPSTSYLTVRPTSSITDIISLTSKSPVRHSAPDGSTGPGSPLRYLKPQWAIWASRRLEDEESMPLQSFLVKQEGSLWNRRASGADDDNFTL